MNRIDTFLLALVIATLAIIRPVSAGPLSTAEQASISQLSSFSPFRFFDAGEGTGYALQYRNRSIPELIAALNAPPGTETRVPCDTIARQLAQAHGLDIEGCSGLTYSLQHDVRWVVVPCSNEMFAYQGGSSMSVTDASAKQFGAYHRACYPGEMILAYDSKPAVSLMCLNVIVPPVLREIARVQEVVPAPAVLSEPSFVPVRTDLCPWGYHLNIRLWDYWLLTPAFQQPIVVLVKAAESRNSHKLSDLTADQPDDVSRTLGYRLRTTFEPPNISLVVRIMLLKPGTPKGGPTPNMLAADLGVFQVSAGFGSFSLPVDPRKYTVVVQTPDGSDVYSPTMDSNGIRELFVFGYEWKDCGMNAHIVVRGPKPPSPSASPSISPSPASS